MTGAELEVHHAPAPTAR